MLDEVMLISSWGVVSIQPGAGERVQERMSPMSPKIIDRGRGPELEGTRVTIFRIMDFVRDGSSPEEMARELELSDDQVSLALDYIAAHRAEVQAVYDQILRRVSSPNPEWVEARLAKTQEELKKRLERRRLVTGVPS
jgi:uncharacterized protein (DUF433 family)